MQFAGLDRAAKSGIEAALIPDGGTGGHCKAQRSAGISGIELIDGPSGSSMRLIPTSKGFSTS
jgi:hypothetical protein